ncbi:hypothetical protein DFR38_12937 [Aquitalea magnusonii]|uniref:Uncharacterized protein n=1 Tax=Aquitalea magnusonii TaxID=332411 RepID=A0A318IWN8_9NEIS|nr:hypothetical protein DFR38_12937 [Aquitalea magnusonii]
MIVNINGIDNDARDILCFIVKLSIRLSQSLPATFNRLLTYPMTLAMVTTPKSKTSHGQSARLFLADTSHASTLAWRKS